jgi:hypothetical protein
MCRLAESNPVKPTTDQGIDRACRIRVKIIAIEHPVFWTSAFPFEVFDCMLIEIAHRVYVCFERVDLCEDAFIKIAEPSKPAAVFEKLIGSVTKQMSLDLENMPGVTDWLSVEHDPWVVRNLPEYVLQAVLGLQTRLACRIIALPQAISPSKAMNF